MGDFDEYEYLEKAVENPETEEEANGVKDSTEGSKLPKRRTEEDADRRTKRSKGEEERVSRRDDRDRDRVRDKDREREKDRDRGRDKDRSSGRSRDRESDRKSRDRDGDRGKSRDRERERERERERVREREEKEKIRDKERLARESRRKEKEKEPEPEADPERDQRTVFAYQINLKADERDVYEFFSRAGKVRDVRLIMDRNSRRSKGVGYIEFYDVMSVPMAIALSGQLLLGQPVMVKPSEAEKNLVQPTPATAMVAGAGGIANSTLLMGALGGSGVAAGSKRLFVENLHPNMNEAELRQVFEPFGPVEQVHLPVDPLSKQCTGQGFIQYARVEDARAAQQNLNGLDLAGRAIKVTAVPDQSAPQDVGPPVSAGELDDDEGGLSLNARSRAELMLKLDRSGAGAGATPAAPASTPVGLPNSNLGMLMPGMAGLAGFPGLQGMMGIPGMVPGVTPAVAGESVGVPSDCLLLKNMFDPDSEKDPDFEEDIKEDVQEECSKFGMVKHIHVDGKSAGHVYIKFDSVTAALAAQRALHGRWFAGKTISALFQTVADYKVKFPES